MDTIPDDEEPRSAGSRPTPLDIRLFLPYVCFQIEAPYRVKVNIEIHGDYRGPDEKPKKARRSVPQATRPTPQSYTPEQESEYMDDAEEIIITAVMDAQRRLIEIRFNRCIEIPRSLIQVLAMSIPYHRHLYRLSVRWGPLTTEALYEISKILYISQLTEMYLDDSPVAGRNYEVLLDRPSSLRCLSLARCDLDDEDCVKIAALLVYPRPAAKTINVLNLVSNIFGDEGASAFGRVLRSNRNLQYLNLAGNRITDHGAVRIFQSLMEFRLTYDEIFGKRSRQVEFLRHRSEVYARIVRELLQDKSHDEIRLSKRRAVMKGQKKLSVFGAVSVANAAYQKADAMTTEVVGLFTDPFSRENTHTREGEVYCVGNLTLCCLNLSYNNLEYASIVSLYDVLLYQSYLTSKLSAGGLLRVCIEGNNLPANCDEFNFIDNLLERAQMVKLKLVKRALEKGKTKLSRH